VSSHERVGVYPGTFDPIHNGHVDIIRRATRVVDRLILAVAINVGKDPLLPLDDRVQLVEYEAAMLMRENRANGCEIRVSPFENLLVDFAQSVGAGLIVRGLRAVSDFEYEFQMASNNARLCPEIETVFLTASETNQFISSFFVKQICQLGGDISSFVSANVQARLDALCGGTRRT
jgi:pantetheine-phosphate adenylyltransferase